MKMYVLKIPFFYPVGVSGMQFINSLIHSCMEQMDLLCAEVTEGNKSDSLLQRPQAAVCMSGVQRRKGLGSSP